LTIFFVNLASTCIYVASFPSIQLLVKQHYISLIRHVFVEELLHQSSF